MPVSTTITTRLQYQHKSLMDLIDGLTDEQIRKPLEVGKWSIFEIIVHLATYQHTFFTRMRQIHSENNPSFSRYVAESDPLFNESLTKSTREIMKDLLVTRKEMAAAVDTYNEQDINKTGQHPVYGTLSMQQWLNFFLLHEAHHLFVIFKQALVIRNPG